MSQPVFKLVANLGDKHPIDYGGYFVFEDTTGVYAPEAELLLEPPDDNDTKWVIYRFILEPCTITNGILSDNKYHPEHPAWFAKDLKAVADFVGVALDQLILDLVCGSIPERAEAWRAIGQYHGFDNLDSYPLALTRQEVEARYAKYGVI